MLRNVTSMIGEIHEYSVYGSRGCQQTEINHTIQFGGHVGIPADAVIDRGTIALAVLQDMEKNSHHVLVIYLVDGSPVRHR